MVRMEATALPVLEMVILLGGKGRSCGQCRRERRARKEQGSRAGAGQCWADASAFPLLRGWWPELEEEDRNSTMDDNIRNNRHV